MSKLSKKSSYENSESDIRKIKRDFRRYALGVQEKWIERFMFEKVDVLELKIDGYFRRIFFVNPRCEYLDEFESDIQKLTKKMQASIASLYAGKSKMTSLEPLLIPTLIRKCSTLSLQTYEAYASREISSSQALNFSRKANVKMGRIDGKCRYFMHSCTGVRYQLVIEVGSRKNISKERKPFHFITLVERINKFCASQYSLNFERNKSFSQKTLTEKNLWKIATVGKSSLIRIPENEVDYQDGFIYFRSDDTTEADLYC